jgi:hypothetical protein
MATYQEAMETKVLWRGKPTTVTVNLGVKEIDVGWNKRTEEPLAVVDIDPETDGLMLFVNGKEYGSIILVEGSATFKNINCIQRLKNIIQLFA